MNFLPLRSALLFIITSFLLSACTPHPGAGVWKATADNEQGISKLTVGFEGKAEFTSSKQNNALWHCFWSTADKKKLALECTPSTNPEQKTSFELIINEQGLAELYSKTTLLATFKRLDENPSPKK
jgi:outer membrane biogenesis lipoprotein LolB